MTAVRDKRLAGLSDAERVALARGEPFPRARPRYNRIIRGVSVEADGLFTILERAAWDADAVSAVARRAPGERSVRSLVKGADGGSTLMASVVSPAAAELEGLGLLERVGEGAEARLRLTAAAEGVALVSTWSMRS